SLRGGHELPARLTAPPSLRSAADVEPEVADFSVLDWVVLPLEAQGRAPPGFGQRASVEELCPADHLRADEPTREVGVDDRRRLDGGGSRPDRPRPHLVLPDREEAG